MRFVPGSHRDGPVVHFRRRDWQLCDTERSGRHVVAVPLKPGGCIFFNGLTHHGTPTNRTDTGRRSVQFHYAPADVPQTTDEQRLAVFGSEGKNVEC
jgi:phytanoyl-CoA hydroxylase